MANSALPATALRTPWGDELDPSAVLTEYPRPQLVRDSYLSLNGWWDYRIEPLATAGGVSPHRGWDGRILVPFSPEAPLSGVGRTLRPDEALTYRRSFGLPEELRTVLDAGGRLLLHFGAVDQQCRVWLDGHEVGGHDGGYLPFTLDLTAALELGTDQPPPAADEHELVVLVTDESDTGWRSRGKQALRPGGIWYTAQSGIWQPVWLEAVPGTWIDDVVTTADLNTGSLTATVAIAGRARPGLSVQVDILADGRSVGAARLGDLSPGVHAVVVPLAEQHRWSPEDPFLYDLQVRLESAGSRIDTVDSYAALRSVEVGPDRHGRLRLLLNGEPYLHAGLLDQGYWPDGLYTAPSDQALVHDVETAKAMGFTMLRKHIKIEPQRWYYHCDRLGMLVWQDLVNGGRPHRSFVVVKVPVVIPLNIDDRHYRLFGRDDPVGRRAFVRELDATIAHLGRHPSIVCWVPFNEGWGQFDANAAAARVRTLDPTRIVDHASGWHDQRGGDLVSRHVYFRRFRMRARDRGATRAVVLSEYGGYSYRVPGHVWSEQEYGYGRYPDAAAFARAFERLQSEQIGPAITEGLAGFCYTQLSDVEEETNGLVTYDRRVDKIDPAALAETNRRLRRIFDESV